MVLGMSKQTPYDPVTGKIADLVVRRPDESGQQVVWLGDRRIGIIFRPITAYDGWTAVSMSQPPRLFGLRMVRGFGTRRAAVEYLLQVGVYLPDNRCIPELDHHPPGYCGSWKPGKCSTMGAPR